MSDEKDNSEKKSKSRSPRERHSSSPPRNPMGPIGQDTPKVLYVANLKENETSADLREFFSQYGPIEDVRVIMNRRTGRSKGYAFVEFKNKEDGEFALRDVPKSDKSYWKVDIARGYPKPSIRSLYPPPPYPSPYDRLPPPLPDDYRRGPPPDDRYWSGLPPHPPPPPGLYNTPPPPPLPPYPHTGRSGSSGYDRSLRYPPVDPQPPPPYHRGSGGPPFRYPPPTSSTDQDHPRGAPPHPDNSYSSRERMSTKRRDREWDSYPETDSRPPYNERYDSSTSYRASHEEGPPEKRFRSRSPHRYPPLPPHVPPSYEPYPPYRGGPMPYPHHPYDYNGPMYGPPYSDRYPPPPPPPHHHHHRERERHRSRSESRSRSPHRSRSRDRDRGRSRDRSRSRDKSTRHTRRTREHSRDREHERNREYDKERDRDRDKEQERDREHDKNRNRDRRRS